MDKADLKPLTNTPATIGPLWPNWAQLRALQMRALQARN